MRTLFQGAKFLGMSLVFAVAVLAQPPGLKIKVVKANVAGKPGDKTEKVFLRVEMENAGQIAYRGLKVHWFIVVDAEPEKPGVPKSTCVSGVKEVTLNPGGNTSFQSEQVNVSKTGQGFWWDPNKKGDPWNWNPRYRGYGVRILSAGKILHQEYLPQTMQKAIEQWEAGQAAKKQDG